MQLHNYSEHFKIREGLYGVYDIKEKLNTDRKSIIFRLLKFNEQKDYLAAVMNVSEHPTEGCFECYCEGLKKDNDIQLADFRKLFEVLEFHVAWFERTVNGSPKLIACVINREYYNRKYRNKD